MRILVHHACYDIDDKAELGAIHETARWIAAAWPGAQIGVLTDSPSRVRAFLPDLVPLAYDSPLAWPRPARMRRPSPLGAGPNLYTSTPEEPELRRVLRTVDDPAADIVDEQPPPPALRQSSLIVCAGGVCLTDEDPILTRRTLAILETARGLNIPVIMTGQGIGPLDDPALLERTGRALAGVNMIGLREGRFSTAVLQRLGVPRDHVSLTGDELLSAVSRGRTHAAGRDIGVSMRVTAGTAVGPDEVGAIGRAIQRVANRHSALMAPVTISERLNEDRVGARAVLGGASPLRPEVSRLATPREIFTQIGRCRVVVTATYGAAVIALGQGIPVVAVARRRAALEAFEGLATTFPTGCRLVSLDMVGVEESIEAAVTLAWQQAPELRAELRTAADERVAATGRFRSAAAAAIELPVARERPMVGSPV